MTAAPKAIPENLRFYVPGATVPAEAQKQFNNGRFKGTDINRMWRIKTLTEMFGPCGIGWTFEIVDIQEYKHDSSDNIVLFGKGILKYRDPKTGEWSEPIIGYGGNFKFSYGKVNDEAYKMLETDCFGTACSKLGIGASVYWSTDRSKYDMPAEDPRPEIKTEPKKREVKDPFFSTPTPKAEAPSVPSNPQKTEDPSITASAGGDLQMTEGAMNNFINEFTYSQDEGIKSMIKDFKSSKGAKSTYDLKLDDKKTLVGMIRSVL